ncbi:MAG: flagellar basal body-associated FliL family protein [Lentisphaerota bacterium]
MAEEQAKPAQDAAAAPAPGTAAATKPKSNMMMVIIIGVVITVLTPLITFFVVKATVPPPVNTEPKKEMSEQATYDLKEIYVNIAETKGTRILKFQPVLVLSEPKLLDQITKLDAMVKDRIIMAASTKTIDELEGPNGKEALKREIVALINSETKDQMNGAVTDVYFTQFLIQ